MKPLKPTEGFLELKSALCAMYRRPEESPWPYSEECLLAEVLRRPDWRGELKIIVSYRGKQSVKWFPRSVNKLLGCWCELLDQARIHSDVVRPDHAPSLRQVIRRATEKWGADDRVTGWAVSFWQAWEKRGWKRTGKHIDWEIELSEQVKKWKG